MSRREQLEQMLADDPHDEFLLYSIAMEYLSEGDAQTARQRFLEMTEKLPEYVPAYFRLGELYAKTEEHTAARDMLNRGIEIARKAGDAHAAGEMTEFRDSLPPE